MAWSPVMRYTFTKENDEPETLLKLINESSYCVTVNERTTLGSTLLHASCLRDNPATTSTLIALGCDINSVNDFGETPLHWSVKAKAMSTCKLLLLNGAFVDIQDTDGNTPLHWACEYGHKSIVKLLVEKRNATIDIENFEEETPLDVAAKSGYPKIVKYFLKRGGKYLCDSHTLQHALFSENEKIISMVSLCVHLNTQLGEVAPPTLLAVKLSAPVINN